MFESYRSPSSCLKNCYIFLCFLIWQEMQSASFTIISVSAKSCFSPHPLEVSTNESGSNGIAPNSPNRQKFCWFVIARPGVTRQAKWQERKWTIWTILHFIFDDYILLMCFAVLRDHASFTTRVCEARGCPTFTRRSVHVLKYCRMVLDLVVKIVKTNFFFFLT